MYSDGSSFLAKANIFLSELKAGSFPNASKLALCTSCSANTAQRVINRLRDEYLVPLEYNQEKHGYFLLKPDYTFPDILPPGKDELSAFVLAKAFLGLINDQTLNQKLNDIYFDYLAKSLHPKISKELKPISDFFSCDFTAVAKIADWGIMPMLQAAITGENLEIIYKSPWRHDQKKSYKCKIKKLHYSDGNLYLLILDTTGSYKTLNAAFIKDLSIITTPLEFKRDASKEYSGHENWLEGFGVYSGGKLEDITIKILPPAAEYYASQTWHDSQEDNWEGKTLVRKMKAMISPEIERRVMSIGRYLGEVEPLTLREKVLEQVREMVLKLK